MLIHIWKVAVESIISSKSSIFTNRFDHKFKIVLPRKSSHVFCERTCVISICSAFFVSLIFTHNSTLAYIFIFLMHLFSPRDVNDDVVGFKSDAMTYGSPIHILMLLINGFYSRNFMRIASPESAQESGGWGKRENENLWMKLSNSIRECVFYYHFQLFLHENRISECKKRFPI